MPNVRRIITDPDTIRNSIHRNVTSALTAKFPIETPALRAELKNLTIEHKPISHNQQRKVIMSKGNVSDGVFADIDIIDRNSGRVINTLARHRMMNLPYFTNRYTFLLGGNEYAIMNQLRTKSGIYTRKRGNDTLESSFNLEKGANFKLLMDPETGKFKVDILHSTMPLFALLKVLGADTNQVRQVLGPELYQVNSNITEVAESNAVNTLYTKLVRYKSELGDTASKAERISQIREYFAGTKMDPETTAITLGAAHTKVDVSSLLAAAKKILQVYNDTADVDERDNLEFQKVYSVEDIVKEVLEKSTTEIVKIKAKLHAYKPTGNESEDRDKLKAIFSPTYFTNPLRNFITTSSISRLPSQINAMEMLDTASIVTRLGEGAIQSEDAVPESTRAVNYSYMGTIDPIAAPESSKIGIDNRFTITALKGDDNEMYKEVRNMRTGQMERLRLIQLFDKNVGMPDEIYARGKGKPSDMVPAVHKGKLVKVKRSQLDYQIDTPHDLNTITTNSLPFINSNQGNRLVMGSKHLTQALPLKQRDTRLVEAVMPSLNVGSTMDIVGSFLEPHAPVNGTVSKIDEDYIYITDKDGAEHKADYQHNTPMATKTMLHNVLSVKPGDKVTKGQSLGDSNFTKDGKLALGRNLKVAYMPYKGMNHEDGIVVSRTAAKKLTSVHSDRITVTMDRTRTLDKAKFISQFPTTYTAEQLRNIDNNGIVRKGVLVQDGDPLILVMGDASESRMNQTLGALHKSLMRPFRDESEKYEGGYPAEVVDSLKSGNTVSVLLKVEKPAGVGDKLSGSYGNKGVISLVKEDDQMPIGEDGSPMDAVFTSASVISRINPAQILETALGKVALKTGKAYEIENFAHKDNVQFVQDELKKHKVNDKETLIDPETGRHIPGIFTGVQHMHKLFKTSDANYAGRGIDGAHDQDEGPVGSGEFGPKALGGMEVNALISHNARHLLKEGAILRNGKNMNFWNVFQRGGNPQMPVEKKSFNKFTSLLNQAGIRLDRKGNELITGPLTDEDVLGMSSGEIKDARRLDAKLAPEAGGLFDVNATGGMGGTKWSHIHLAEPVMNPVFEDCVRALLGYNGRQLEDAFAKDGGKSLRDKLNAINVPQLLKESEDALDDPKLKGDTLNKMVKKVKYLRALNQRGLKAGDAYMLENIPVTPPVMRPITIGKTGDKLENDANLLYRNLILENNTFDKIRGEQGMQKETEETRKSLQNSVRELVGTMSPQSPQLKNSGVKGALQFISGDQPKHGFFQKKVVYSKMNLSGRATISPDTTLELDEVGLPEDMAWSMYKPFIIRQLTQLGYGAMQARTEVDNKSDIAKKILEDELKKRPVIINRAPTLWKHGLMAAKPQLRSGKNLQINTLWESGYNSDFDGDAMQVHLPVSDEAIADANNMLPSKLIFSDKKKGDLLMAPKIEPIMGLYKVTQNLGRPLTGTVHKFPNESEAWKAYNAGRLKATDLVEIG